MLELTLAHQFARILELEDGSNGTQFHVNTISGGVCSSAGGGAFDCSEDRDATL